MRATRGKRGGRARLRLPPPTPLGSLSRTPASFGSLPAQTCYSDRSGQAQAPLACPAIPVALPARLSSPPPQLDHSSSFRQPRPLSPRRTCSHSQRHTRTSIQDLPPLHLAPQPPEQPPHLVPLVAPQPRRRLNRPLDALVPVALEQPAQLGRRSPPVERPWRVGQRRRRDEAVPRVDREGLRASEGGDSSVEEGKDAVRSEERRTMEPKGNEPLISCVNSGV